LTAEAEVLFDLIWSGKHGEFWISEGSRWRCQVWGQVKGGYGYVTYKKKYSDARMIDTAMDGGFLQMGFVF
jgi:hypothetical protein